MLVALQICVDLENADSGHSGSLSHCSTGKNLGYYDIKAHVLKGNEALWDNWFQGK